MSSDKSFSIPQPPRRVWVGMLSALAIGCGSDSNESTDGGIVDDSGSFQEEHGPVFHQFGSNVRWMTEGESITITAVVSDPDGIDDVIGGTLRTPDGVSTYGAFQTTDQEGAYELQLTWDQVNRIEPINFDARSVLVVVAEFFDADGHRGAETLALELHCDDAGGSACSGECADVAYDRNHCGSCGTACPIESLVENSGTDIGRAYFDSTSTYWATDNQIVRIDDGVGTTTKIANGVPSALTGTADTVYWLRGRTITQYSKSSQQAQTFVTTPTTVKGLAVDESHVYTMRLSQVYRYSRANEDIEARPEVVSTNMGGGNQMLAHGDSIFWANSTGDIVRWPKSGEPAVVVADQEKIKHWVGNGDRLYFLTEFDQLFTVPMTGGAPTLLASGHGAITTFYIEAGHLYFGAGGTSDSPSAIKRVAISGGEVATIVETDGAPAAVGVRNGNVHWTEGGAPLRLRTTCVCDL